MDSLSDLLLKQKQVMAIVEAKKAEIQPIDNEVEVVTERIKADRDATAKRIHELELIIRAERDELDERLQAERKRQEELRASKFDLNRELKEAQRQADSLQRQIEQAERANMEAAEWATLEKRWDLLTAGATWREWAKDHQLDGARKITYEGSLILGDTMGLGKTLTAIIAFDMIKAATAEASPDNPVEFGSMK